MNVKREIIALTVRILANNTTVVRKPDSWECILDGLFGHESYDQRMARDIEVELDRATEAVKRVNLNRKFKKIVRNV
jgi:hypothetical protein